MRISLVKTTPLLVPYKQPFHWAQGIIHSAGVILVEVHTDEGIVGIGECIATPSAEAVQMYLKLCEEICLGCSPFANARLMDECYHTLFKAYGTNSAPRFSGQVLAGLEMALWDTMGKVTGHAVHELLGGAVRDEILYFGFPQGDKPEEIAAQASLMAENGHDVIYVKVGRGDALDIEIARQVRSAIGPEKRLRVDPNEHWSPIRATRMIRKMVEFDVDMVEQPTHCESVSALAQVRASSPAAIAADQLVFTPFNAFDVCREKAADMIVLGLHETGGINRFRKIANIAEAAGIDICIHGLYETGITTIASNHVAATLPNLDDGNQFMNHLLEWDIVKKPNLKLKQGQLPVLPGPGFGIDIDDDAIAQATEEYIKAKRANQ
ncbi:MAG: muconate cycloisomerase [Phycisphaerae bacterium]|nr:mandelate racemase/muconate lactonizing enzyme family protein [Phycisphaerae bacterium]NIW97013.1 muconate cycloisomerase [Phycisphaerae bacterium]